MGIFGGTSRLTVTVIKRWLQNMFWGLWAGQPGYMKMGDHKTLLNAVTSSSSEHEIHRNAKYGYDGTPMKHCKVCVRGGG